MDDFLRKIGILDSFQLPLDVDKNEFLRSLKENMDDDDGIGFMHAFSSSKNRYMGYVYEGGFELKNRPSFFSRRSSYTKAKGEFLHERQQLIIDIDIIGANKAWIIIYYSVLVLVYAGLIAAALSNKGNSLGFLFVHGMIMIFIPYFQVKRNVKNMKYDLERDLLFISTKR